MSHQRHLADSVKVSESPFAAADREEAAISGQSEAKPRRDKILYVVGSLDLGGTERHLVLVAPGLKRMGWEPVIYCLTRPGEQASEVCQAGVQVISAPFLIDSKQGWLIPRAFKLLLSMLKLWWVMVATRPKIAHFFLPGAYLIGAPLALFARIPIRVMSRRSLNRYQANHSFVAWIERRLHPHMSAILGNSRQVVRELISEGAPPERVALIYNGIDVASFAVGPSPLSERDWAKTSQLVLITVANLIPYKGHADLLAALAHIAPKLPQRWSLICVGRDDGIGAKLKQQARACGIEANVKLAGPRSDVAELLAGADIGILASHEEGFSNSVLEGMAAGLPMIVTDVGGNAEAVVHKVVGLVTPPRNPSALAAAILKLAQDRPLRRAMGEAGRKRVERCFGIEQCVTHYSELYSGLLKQEIPAEIHALATQRPD